MLKLICLFAYLVLSVSPALQAQTDVGTADIGSSTTATATVTILHPGTLASITVTTGGKQNLDFTSTGGTCNIGDTYAVADTCTVEVIFAPGLAGLRYGGILLLNQDGSIGTQSYLRGTGRGPQIIYWPGTKTQLLNDIVLPNGLATDSSGSVYAVEGSWEFSEEHSGGCCNGRVLLLPGNRGATAPGTTDFPTGISADGAGNTYLIDDIDWESILLPNGGYSTVVPPLNNPPGNGFIGNDAQGNRYALNSSGLQKETLQSDGTYVASTIPLDPNSSVVYIDANGDIFTTENDGTLHEYVATPGGYTQISGNMGPAKIAAWSADGLGNIYGGDTSGNVYKETPLPDGNAVKTYLFNNALTQYTGNSVIGGAAGGNRLAADSAGNIYFWANTGTANYQAPNPNIGPQTYPLYGLFEENYSLPSTLTFDQTVQGSTTASQTVVVTNSGNLPLQISTIAFPADFNETSAGAGECTEGVSLQANATCALTIRFAPIAPIHGTSAQLTEQVMITTNQHNAPGTQQAITVTGLEINTSAPILSISPASINFPMTFPGTTSLPIMLTVTNNSANVASVSSYKFTGASASQFELANKTCVYSLAAHASCTLTVVYKPTAAGAASATLVATDNAVGTPQSVALSGSGIPIDDVYLFIGGSLSFPPTKVGTTSAPRQLTVWNSNTTANVVPVLVSSYLFTGPNANEFALVGKTCNAVLAANASCTLSIVFKPTMVGPASASVTANATVVNSPQSAPITGTGN